MRTPSSVTIRANAETKELTIEFLPESSTADDIKLLLEIIENLRKIAIDMSFDLIETLN